MIPTSGTTNTPKLVSHQFSSLTRTVKKDIQQGEKYVWGMVFDIYRFSGLQVLLQSLLSGSTLVLPDADSDMDKIVDVFRRNNCNTLSATPSFWRKLLMSKSSNGLNLKNITLGGEISDNNILNVLKTKFPNSSVRHIYASTEVGVGFSVNDGKAGFPRKFLVDGVNGIELKVDDNSILWLKPDKKAQRYLNGEQMFDKEGFINTGDLVEINGERIYFLGRESGAINVGGNKVHPEQVEETLLQSGLISSAYVYSMNNPIMGSLVCANIVANENGILCDNLKSHVIKFCRERLEGFKVPALLKVVEDLEINNSGKLKRGRS